LMERRAIRAPLRCKSHLHIRKRAKIMSSTFRLKSLIIGKEIMK